MIEDEDDIEDGDDGEEDATSGELAKVAVSDRHKHIDALRPILETALRERPSHVAAFAVACAQRASSKSKGTGKSVRKFRTRMAGAARAAADQCEAWVGDLERGRSNVNRAVTERTAVTCAVQAAFYELCVVDSRETHLNGWSK